MKNRKTLFITGVAIIALIVFATQFRKSVNYDLGSLETPFTSTNLVMEGIREMYAERGWDTVYARGTPESWTHIAKDKKGREVVVRINFHKMRSHTEIIIPDTREYSLEELTHDLASRLGIAEQTNQS